MCQTDSILTLSCVIVSKWVTSLIVSLIISCPKSVFSTHYVDEMKKQPKFGVLLQPPNFTIY